METATLDESATPALGVRDLAGTGAMVSRIGLDGAVFGWAAGIDETARVLDTYAAAGGNLISTADHYAGGRSEIMIGQWLSTVSDRRNVILETRIGRHPDARGLGKHSILRAVENSLTRFGTDYIDFLSLESNDNSAPLEESLETCYRLISEGKVRFLASAGFGAAKIREAERLSEESGGPRFRAIVAEYNLMTREPYERELQPLAVELGRGALARLPLANGYLTGEFRTREDVPDDLMFHDAAKHVGRRGDRILAAVSSVAKELGETETRVALAWVLVKPGIASAVLRVRDADHLTDALGAVNVRLGRQHLALLDRASAP